MNGNGRKRQHQIPTSMRINAIVNGRMQASEINWAVAYENGLTNQRTEIASGFVSPEAAILFLTTGSVKYCDISVQEMTETKSLAGFFRHLGESEVAQLLTHHKACFSENRQNHVLVLYKIERENGFELIVEGD